MKLKENMRKTAIFFGLFLFIAADYSYAAPLKIEIAIKGDSFSVSTKIKNISDKDQTISIWTGCYDWSWISNRPEIITGLGSCLSNFPTMLNLKPGEEYSRDISIGVSSQAKPGALTFQLGFNPKANWLGTRTGIIPKTGLPSWVLWSNEVTLMIKPETQLMPVSHELEEKSKHLDCASYPCK